MAKRCKQQIENIPTYVDYPHKEYHGAIHSWIFNDYQRHSNRQFQEILRGYVGETYEETNDQPSPRFLSYLEARGLYLCQVSPTLLQVKE